MLPVVAGRDYAILNILVYSVVLAVLATLFAVLSNVGWIYMGSAAVLGAAFVWFAWRLRRDGTQSNAKKLYLYSLLYLALLFSAIILDSSII